MLKFVKNKWNISLERNKILCNYKNGDGRRNVYIIILKYLVSYRYWYVSMCISIYYYDDDNGDGEGQVLRKQIKIKY